jgi:hypothetical protein
MTTNIESSPSSLFDAQDVGSVIREGELPGYKGWARPFSTLAHHFIPHDRKIQTRSTIYAIHNQRYVQRTRSLFIWRVFILFESIRACTVDRHCV